MTKVEQLEQELTESRRVAAKWRRKSIDGCCCRFDDEDQPIETCGIHAAVRDALRKSEAAKAELLKAAKTVYKNWDGEPEDMIELRAAIKKAKEE
jgi:hypothetical protein